MILVPYDITVFAVTAFYAIMRGRWDVAAEQFNRAHLECLVRAIR